MRIKRTPGHSYTYAFANGSNCGNTHTAGRNTNRTSATVDGGAATTYCYDAGDRLMSCCMIELTEGGKSIQ